MRRLLLAAALAAPLSLAAQANVPLPERAVRRDIPLTNSIRRAFATGTRDSTGRPGRNYWQLRTDYTIQVRLDPATGRLEEFPLPEPDALPYVARVDHGTGMVWIGTGAADAVLELEPRLSVL